jgi:hypothetical protein
MQQRTASRVLNNAVRATLHRIQDELGGTVHFIFADG